MTDKRDEQAYKSLKWVVNQIPNDLGDSREEKMLKCIKLYCENGAETINNLQSTKQQAETQLKELLSALYQRTIKENGCFVVFRKDIVKLAKDYGIKEKELNVF